jgi:hypothetical protein
MRKFILVFYFVFIIFLLVTNHSNIGRVLIFIGILSIPIIIIIKNMIKEKREENITDHEYLKQKIKLRLDDDIKE